MMDKYINELEILYEDNHILVAKKFINILSQKDETNDISMNDIVKEYIKRKYNKPGNVYLGLIHRLDRRVGGVMVFAKTSKAASRLSEDIRKHNFDKKYIAMCEGEVDSGKYIDYLMKDDKNKIAYIDKKGKEAILEYQLINKTIYNGKTHSYVKVKLITGRYNQIRCQMASHNHPLVNDYKYGYKSSSKNGDIGLWCCEVEFTHPVTKEKMIFRSYPSGSIWTNLEKGA